MLQEVYQSDKSTPKSDLVLVIVLLALFVFARDISVWLRSLPLGALWLLLVFFGLLGFVYYIYKSRLISYRYTLTFEENDDEKSEMFGDTVKNPYPLGSLLIERMSGSRGRVLELVIPQEYEELLPAGEACAAEAAKGKTFQLTSQSRKKAYRLYFKRDGALYCMFFSPSEEMAMRLDTMIKELRQA